MPWANCASWIVGHLVLTERRILGFYGVELPALPDGFTDKFSPTRQAAGEQTGLGDPASLVAEFDRHRELLIATVLAATPEKLSEPLPKPHPMFGTIGEATAFMGIHVALHVGQITTICRHLGYPPAA